MQLKWHGSEWFERKGAKTVKIELFGKYIDVDGEIDAKTAIKIIQDALDDGNYDEYYTQPDIETFVATSSEEYLADLIQCRIQTMKYQDINAATIDRWIEEGWEWGKPISHEAYCAAKRGEWEVFLTPTKPVPHEWIGTINGKKVLGLASGGGQQMPILTALGAECMVLDYSEKQIESERMVAEREKYDIHIVRADMSKRLPFDDGVFDMVFHPVSNCYIRDVKPVWRECWRILKPGGVLLSGVDHYINYIVDEEEREIINHLPFDPLADETQRAQLEAADAGMQFSHSLEEQINGQLEAGFTLLNLYEDTNGEGRLHELNIPTFLAMRAVKR